MAKQTKTSNLEARIAAVDWTRATHDLLEHGYAVVPPVLTTGECREIIALFKNDRRGQPVTDLGERGFGGGQYRYLKYPLPMNIRTLQRSVYERIVDTANVWSARLRYGVTYPPRFHTFQSQRRKAGQPWSLPAILRYPVGGHNNLHQDLSDETVFPYQVIFGLSKHGRDYHGGYLVLLQERRGGQAVPHVIPIPHGGAVILASARHPQRGPRGYRRCDFRHGVAKVERGLRWTLGIVFHTFVD